MSKISNITLICTDDLQGEENNSDPEKTDDTDDTNNDLYITSAFIPSHTLEYKNLFPISTFSFYMSDYKKDIYYPPELL